MGHDGRDPGRRRRLAGGRVTPPPAVTARGPEYSPGQIPAGPGPARDDPGPGQRLARVPGSWIATRIALAAALIAAGALVLVFATGAVGIGAAIPGCIMIFIGGYDLPLRLRQLRRNGPRSGP